MFIRVFIIKFPNENKKELAATFIDSLKPRFHKESKILEFQTLLHRRVVGLMWCPVVNYLQHLKVILIQP